MIKKFKNYKIFESYSKPEPKYPVNYKCLDLSIASKEIEHEYGFNLYDVPAPGSKYGNMNFYSWCQDEIDLIYPKYTTAENLFEFDKIRYAGYPIKPKKRPLFEYMSICELPIRYDSSNDENKWTQKLNNYRKEMGDMLKSIGKEYNPDNEKHINFGPKSNDWVNMVLTAFHDLYSQYYENGKLRIWNDDDEYSREKQIFDYPLDKAIFLSELEEFISDFDINTQGFYDWILNCQYIEGRYWERNWTYEMSDQNFRKNKASDNVKKINELLRQIYKQPELNIYIDYFKKVDDKILR